VGYRIKRDDYKIQIQELSSEEGLLAAAALTLVATLRADLDLGPAQLKLGSLIPAGPNPLERIITSMSEAQVIKTPAFLQLLSAIRERVTVSFDYIRDIDSVLTRRRVEPWRLLLKDQEWLLQGWDLDREAIRFFIIENIEGEVTHGKKFEINHVVDSSLTHTTVQATNEIEVLAPNDLEALLVSEGGLVLGRDGSAVKFLFRTYNRDRLFRILISIDPTILVISPPEAVESWAEIKKRLRDAI